MPLPTLTENQFSHSGDKTTFYWSAGLSDGPLIIFGGPEAYALEHYLSDLLALLTYLRREKAVWVGHDWGAALVWGFASHHLDKCVAVCCLCVPYVTIDPVALCSLSNRNVYPEDEFPYAQWDYQIHHNEQPEATTVVLSYNIPNTIKAFYRAGNPEAYGKPARTSYIRKIGGWFAPSPGVPDVPIEKTMFKDNRPAFDRIVAEFKRNGFEGPNNYYRNIEANKAYAAKAPNGGRLSFPVLFIGARFDITCDTTTSRLSEPMRELCEDLTEVTIDAGHWVAMEKPEETNSAIVRWIATKVPTYFPGYWKTPFVTRV
ncbi:alpha/beta-hydrolase [Colletotrichum eremochloae]|nr:alpha/beta-hydrolase [Colletotrichum eremochloae]